MQIVFYFYFGEIRDIDLSEMVFENIEIVLLDGSFSQQVLDVFVVDFYIAQIEFELLPEKIVYQKSSTLVSQSPLTAYHLLTRTFSLVSEDCEGLATVSSSVGHHCNVAVLFEQAQLVSDEMIKNL